MLAYRLFFVACCAGTEPSKHTVCTPHMPISNTIQIVVGKVAMHPVLTA